MSTETERDDATAESLASAMLPVFARMAPRLPARPGWRALRLFVEALLYAGLGLLVAAAIDLPQSGLFAIFLSAAGLSGRLSGILDENRYAIYVEHRRAREANRATIASLLALFLGLFTAFAIAALRQGEPDLRAGFGFVLDTAHLGRDTLATRRFGQALPLFTHNALVLLVFIALSFVYRAYGALLVLSWNGCTWGLILAVLTRRGLHESDAPPALFLAASLLAVLPHLVLEAAGYVVGAIAAIFFSRAFAKYPLDHPVFRSVLRAVAVLLLISLACLALGAVVESVLPAWAMSLSR